LSIFLPQVEGTNELTEISHLPIPTFRSSMAEGSAMQSVGEVMAIGRTFEVSEFRCS
jgi:carbamoylphosphate synthase large subunit